MRFCLHCLATGLSLALLLTVGPSPADQPPAKPPEAPKLAVLIYFDQMRGDFLTRWRELYGEGGLRRLCDDGAWFQECHYPFANTMTGPGHASVAAGCSPDVNGIVANEWFSLKAGEQVYCAGDDRYAQVPPARPDPKGKKAKGIAPTRLLVPTIADALRLATAGKGVVVALSLKDRSCVLPAGQKPGPGDAVYWAAADGLFVTSTFYRDKLHDWVAAFNKSGFTERWRGKSWERLRADLDYDKYAGPDDAPGEGTGTRQGRAFPHPFEGEPTKPKDKKKPTDYYAAVANSPAGNDLLLELAKRAIDAEKLGGRAAQDLLILSFSSNDLVGHTWGPDSHEVLDITLRSDLLIKDLLAFLDRKVGKGKYVVALSADHGVCPTPQANKKRGKDGGTLDADEIKRAAEAHLDPARKDEKGKDEKAKGGYIAAMVGNMVYLDRAVVKARGKKVEDVAGELARWLVKQPGIQAAYTRAALASSKDEAAAKWRRSYHAGESGDLMLVTKPGWYFWGKGGGTTHGSPHDYDTHVPLVVYGPGIKPGVRKGRVSPEAAAPSLARALGIKPPAKATAAVPEGLFAAAD